jgi:hypothetical protein
MPDPLLTALRLHLKQLLTRRRRRWRMRRL